MWDCENCGCKAIAESLYICPMCGTEYPKESAVPDDSGTASGGKKDAKVDKEAE
jgi:hypothetical protein